MCNFNLFIDQKFGEFHHQTKHSFEVDNGKLSNEFGKDVARPIGEDSGHTNSDANYASSHSQQVHDVAHNHQILREQWAAIRIQTAFRGFLVIFHIKFGLKLSENELSPLKMLLQIFFLLFQCGFRIVLL